MKTRTYSRSSYDSSDDEILALKKETKYVVQETRQQKVNDNAYSSLCKQDWQQCEFCDKLFINRYTLFCHNVDHLVIPLTKQTPHQCKDCHDYFTTSDELALHIFKHHSKQTVNINSQASLLQGFVKKELKIQCENDLNEVLVKYSESNSKKHVINDNLSNNSDLNRKSGFSANAWTSKNISDCIINETNSELDLKSTLNESNVENNTRLLINNIKYEDDIVKDEPLSPTPILRNRLSSPVDEDKESIRQRLIFEEDIEDTLFRDLSAECHMNIETFCQEVSLDFDNDILVEDDDTNSQDLSNGIDNFKTEISDNENYGNETDNLFQGINNFGDGTNNFVQGTNDFVQGTSNFVQLTNNFEEAYKSFVCTYSNIGGNTNNLHGINNFGIGISNFNNAINNSNHKTTNVKSGIDDFTYGNERNHVKTFNVRRDVLDIVKKPATDLLQYGKAIHFDDLMIPELCTCRLCGKEFPDRFHLLLHEPTHIKIKKTHWSVLLCCICDKYIAGNYHTMRKHKIKEHPEIDDSNVRYTTHICPKCHLKYYNYRKHLKNYHKQYQCEKCLCCFDMSPQKNEHKCETLTNVQRVLNESTTSMMQLCDLCFTFMRVYMQNRLNYEEIGTKSELGVQQTCDKCCNKFFTVKLVKRRPLARPLPCEDNRRKHIVPKVKALSNRERLIKIQNRLKMMKKFNKC